MRDAILFSLLAVAVGELARRVGGRRGWSGLQDFLPNARRERRLQAVFRHTAVGIATLDRHFTVTEANDALARLLGLELSSVTGRRFSDFLSAEDAASAAAAMDAVTTGEREVAVSEARYVRHDGGVGWCSVMLSACGADADAPLVAVVQDVSERKTLEAKLVHQGTHDTLSQLPNRAMFRDRAELALSRTAREERGLAMIVLDLDDFKSVNDTDGHGAGDRLLQVVSRRLLAATRGCDTVARLGGDEFAVLLEQVDARSGAEAVVERIIASLRRPVDLGTGRSVSLCASAGIAIYSGHEDAEQLLRNADVAMYEAKQRTRGRWVVFDGAMHVALIDRVTLESDLRAALERCQLIARPRLANTAVYPAYEAAPPQSEFSVVYQPIVDLRTGVMTGVEALARWTHPTRGTVSPEAFIPLAESSDLIASLGRYIVREACRQGAKWNRARSGTPLTITVNLSGRQLERDEIAAEVDSILRETGLAPAQLVLEITETVIMRNDDTTLDRLRALKRLGVRLAIDDFGTGFSSLSYLQRFPVDIVKIDRLFVDGMREGTEGSAFMRTILSLADMLHLQTIAEGVEYDTQVEQLCELGCAAGQGYLFGRPMTSAAIGALMLAEPLRSPAESVLEHAGDEPAPARVPSEGFPSAW
ncbi:MAG: EAL domain-containing protein [Gemmatimonadaceae bacterium]